MADRIEGIMRTALGWVTDADIPLQESLWSDVVTAARTGIVRGRGNSLAKKMAQAYLRLLMNRLDEQLTVAINNANASVYANGSAEDNAVSEEPSNESVDDGTAQPTSRRRGSRA